MIARTINLLIGILICHVSFGQVASEFIDLKLALELAKTNYPSIKLKLAETEATGFELKAANVSYAPQFIVQAQAINGTSNQVRGPFFPNEGMAIPVSGGIKPNGYTATSTWASYATGFVRWNVYSFGKIKASVESAKARQNAAQADYENELFQQQIKVADAYLIDLTARGIASSQRVNLDRVRALKEVILAYTKSGLKSGVDSSLVKAEYSKALLQYLDARRAADEQEVFLKEQMGLSSDRSVVIDTITFSTRLPQPLENNWDYSKNPRLLYFKRVIDFDAAQIKAIGKRELPSVSLLGATWARGSGIQDRTAPNGDLVYDKSFSSGVSFRPYMDWFLGVSTIWNITNSYRNKQEARAQQQKTVMAQERYNEETLKVESEVARAKLRYATSLEAARQAPVQLAAARDAYFQARARYDAGLTSILELTQTYALLNRAEVDLAIAQGNVWRALILYAAATGNLDVFTGNF